MSRLSLSFSTPSKNSCKSTITDRQDNILRLLSTSATTTSSSSSFLFNFHSGLILGDVVVDGVSVGIVDGTTGGVGIGDGIVAVGGSGYGVAVGVGVDVELVDIPRAVFETQNDQDYDHTGSTDFSVNVTVRATAEQHIIPVDNPLTTSKEKEKIKSVSPDESLNLRLNYPFEGFNISDGAPTQLTNIYLEWIVDGLLKYHANSASITAYAEDLSDGLQVLNNGLNAKVLHNRYATLLWNYGIV
ncbi:hypothetical protein FXO38_22104 [Capsicum annuum]|nr:hypothetical protein FXO38_22104 [Capsicum annuum]